MSDALSDETIDALEGFSPFPIRSAGRSKKFSTRVDYVCLGKRKFDKLSILFLLALKLTRVFLENDSSCIKMLKVVWQQYQNIVITPLLLRCEVCTILYEQVKVIYVSTWTLVYLLAWNNKNSNSAKFSSQQYILRSKSTGLTLYRDGGVQWPLTTTFKSDLTVTTHHYFLVLGWNTFLRNDSVILVRSIEVEATTIITSNVFLRKLK